MVFTSDPTTINVESSKRFHATYWAEAGFKVMRLPPQKKFPPLGNDWQNWPTKTADEAEEFWTDPDTGESTAHNIAIQTGLGFIVLDFDFRKGGKAAFEATRIMLPRDTLTIKTPNGYHLYFEHEHELSGGAEVLAHRDMPGVDLRAHHGYVVAAGSEVDGKPYTVECETPMIPLPGFLKQWLGSRPVSKHTDQTPIIDQGNERIYQHALQQARDWLKAPHGLAGESCDGHTFATAAKLKDIGLTPDDAVSLLFDHERQFGPIVDEAGMEHSIRNAFGYARGSKPGEDFRPPADMEFERVEIAGDLHARENAEKGHPGEFASPTARRSPIRIEPWGAVADVEVQWLVDGLLPSGGFGALYGQPGSYKSFVALHMAACVASGTDFLGQKVTQGAVLYIAAEGGYGLRKRLDAIEKAHGLAPGNVYFLRASVDLRSTRESAEKIVAALTSSGIEVALVVVDTMARTFGGGNENSSEDMGAYISVVDDVLREGLGAAVLLVHHSGKDVARGMRGHNSLFGAVDAEIETEQHAKVPAGGGSPGAGAIKVTKQKDGPDGWRMEFAVEEIELGESRASLSIRSWQPGETIPGSDADGEAGESGPIGGVYDATDLADLHNELSRKTGRKDARSPQWAGRLVAESCGFDHEHDWKRKAKKVLKRLHRCGAIEVIAELDGHRHEKEYWIPMMGSGLEWIDALKNALGSRK